MANSKNFPNPIVNVPNSRPRRLSQQDLALVRRTDVGDLPQEKEVVFGQTARDIIEVYAYDELNNIVGHINIRPENDALRLIAFVPSQQVGIGQDKTPDVLQLDLVRILKQMGPADPMTGIPIGLPPGRYNLVANVFRDEVGQEAGGNNRRLFISEISPSRTELRLVSVENDAQMVSEIHEFVEPSVPRFVAQAIIDETFGVALSSITDGGQGVDVSYAAFKTAVAALDADKATELTTAARLQRSRLEPHFQSIYDASLPRIREQVLNELEADIGDLQIQDSELQEFIRKSVTKVLIAMVSTGEVDRRLQINDSDGTAITPTTTNSPIFTSPVRPVRLGVTL
jgi:hypothetical protein